MTSGGGKMALRSGKGESRGKRSLLVNVNDYKLVWLKMVAGTIFTLVFILSRYKFLVSKKKKEKKTEHVTINYILRCAVASL